MPMIVSLRPWRTLLLALPLVTLPWSVHADELLTKKQVEQWLQAMPAVQSFADQNETAIDRFDTSDDLDHLFDEQVMVKPLKDAGLYDEFEDLVEDFGFDDPEEWAGISGRIFKALVAAQMAEQGSSVAAMQAQMDQMMQNPSLPPEAKAMMEQHMAQAKAMIKAAGESPQADQETIKPYLPQIQALMESEGAAD